VLDDIPKLLITVADKGGPAVVAILVIIVLVESWLVRYLYKELRHSEKDHKTETDNLSANRDQMFRDRYDDATKVILALEHSSQASLALERSSEQRVIALGRLTEGFVQLAADIKRQEEWRRDLATRFERSIDDIRNQVSTSTQRLETILSGNSRGR
jgi:hypothetical protein